MPISVAHLAHLSSLTVTQEEEKRLASQFEDTLKVVGKLSNLDTTTVEATPHVTGLRNCFRQDEIDASRTLSQHDAMKNASATHNGFFIVPALLKDRP